MVDLDKLPRRVLIDTGVVLRAFGSFPEEPHSAACIELVDQMIGHQREILIAAPTITEIMRGQASPIPRIEGIEVVAFDDQAAMYIGGRLPFRQLKALSGPNISATHLKYDALIVGCAVRHHAECVVSLDEGVHKIAGALAFPCYWPSYFAEAQPLAPR